MAAILKWPAALVAGLFLAVTARADVTLEPKPAEIMPKADDWILNDITRAGDAYVAVGDRGHVLRSENGRDWNQVAAPVQAMLNKVRFFDAQHGWIVGHDATALKTTDGGRSWKLMHHDAEWGKPAYDILFLDRQHGFMVAANSVFKETRDGGNSWELLEPDFTFPGMHLNNILQLSDGTIVISGEKGMMVRSIDGGASWQQVRTPYAGSFFGMLPFGDAGVFVFGLRGNVYSAADIKSLPPQDSMEWDEFSLETVTDNAVLAARGWRYYPNDLKESLFGGAVLGPKDVLLVGVNGAVVRTDGQAMRSLSTGIEHTLGSALLSDKQLISVGLLGIETVPIAP